MIRRFTLSLTLLSLMYALAPGHVSAGDADEYGPAKEQKEAEPAEAKSGKSLAEIVDGATKHEGLVTFHRKPGALWLELPPAEVGAPLGFSAVLVSAAGDFFVRGGAIETRLVRFDRVGDSLVLHKENLDFRVDSGDAMRRVVADSFPDSPVFSALLIELNDEPGPLLVDASDLFAESLAEILPETSSFTVSKKGALLESLDVFADNVVARVRHRLDRKPGPAKPDGNPFSRFQSPGRLPDRRSASIVVDYNFYRLPEDDFVPRRADERIGGFTMSYKDYSEIAGKESLFTHMLRRWDIQPQDPSARLSPPVKPITFYMDHSIPPKWRPLVREAAEWWNPAFEAIGIKDAVQVLDPPDDPDWDAADLAHSVIYFNISDDLVFSGMAGPMFVDPRNGKVLKANVYLNGEFFSYALNRYLVYAWWRAPDPATTDESLRIRREVGSARPEMCDRAASFSSQLAFARLVLQARGVIEPGSADADRFAREAFFELVAHEVGHALGFPHNWKASLASSWTDLRDGKVSGRRGDDAMSASVMDYNPIYLAPRGTAQGDYFLTEAGTFDFLFVEYIYKPLEHLSPKNRERELDRIAAKAETEPGLIFDSGLLGQIDPTTSSDDLGDDPLAFAASRLEILHEEVLPRLPELVLAEGHDYNLLRQALDSAIFSVAMDYIDIAARHVGGQIVIRRVASSPSSPAGGARPITPIPAAEQRRALKLIDDYVFADGQFALSPDTLAQLKPDLMYDWNYPWRYASDYDLANRIAGLYDSALASLLEPARLARILDNERRTPADARFTLVELFGSLERSAFTGELDPIADRRALQRLLVQRLTTLVLEPSKGTPAEASQLAASSLRSIEKRTKRAASSASGNGYARPHFEDLSRRAARTLAATVQTD